MGMLLVVMLKPNGQVARSGRCIRLRHEGDVIALHRPYEALGHTVTLRAAHRRGQWLQTDGHCKPACVVGRVAQPLSLCHSISRPGTARSNGTAGSGSRHVGAQPSKPISPAPGSLALSPAFVSPSSAADPPSPSTLPSLPAWC